MILVYTSSSLPDPGHGGKRCVRMALHPLDCKLMGQGPKFPFRVAWRWDCGDDSNDGWGWMVSCRGEQSLFDGRVTFAMYTQDLDEVLSWLLAGEPEAVQAEVMS